MPTVRLFSDDGDQKDPSLSGNVSSRRGMEFRAVTSDFLRAAAIESLAAVLASVVATQQLSGLYQESEPTLRKPNVSE